MDRIVATSPATRSETKRDSSVVDPSMAGSSIIGYLTIGATCEPAGLATRQTILLVEDESFVRRAMALALGSSGYRVLTAANGSQALATCRMCALPPDLLLSDMVMPDMSGAYLATLFEAMYPWTRVLLMSGYAEELSPFEARLPRAAQLRKPFSAGTLIKVIGEMFDADTRALGAPPAKV